MSPEPYTITITLYDENDKLLLDKTQKWGWHYANGATWATPVVQQNAFGYVYSPQPWNVSNNVPEVKYVLTMGGSGTSGCLRFERKSGKPFLVAVGVHNYKRWCHIVTDLSKSDTTHTILPTYYGGIRDENLWKQREKFTKTDKNGFTYNIEFKQKTGHNLTADLSIW
jgi:hypothetical protein